MQNRKLPLIIFFIIFTVLTFFLLTPSPPKIDIGISFFDKVEHFAAFFILAFLFSAGIGCGRTHKKLLLLSFLFLAVYGILIEIIQRYTGRSVELYDIIADISGIAAGEIFLLFFYD